jgi:circadian clock protein KaiC
MLLANISDDRAGAYFFGPGQQPAPLAPNAYCVYLGDQLTEREAARVLETLVREAYNLQASFVVVDLVQGLTDRALWNDIVMYLSVSDVTSVLVADASPSDASLSAADSVVSLRQTSAGRCIQVLKARGQEPLPGAHAMRITHAGARVFPRWPTPLRRVERVDASARLPVGVEQLGRLMGGGAPVGGTVLVDGPSGSGKSILATQFIAECAHDGHPGVVLLFEERPDRFLSRAAAMDLELERLQRCGMVDVLSFRGRDMPVDELIYEVQRTVISTRAECMLIDSTAGLELIVGDDFQDCMWRLLDSLTGMGVTVWLNHSPAAGERSFLGALADDVIELRQVEHNGRAAKYLEVVKASCYVPARGAQMYEIGERGLEMLKRVDDEHPSSNGHVVGYNGVTVMRNGAALRN